MFQITFLPSHGVNVVHPPEHRVTPDMLFEQELLFVWDNLLDPHVVKEQLGRYVPFAPAMIDGHSRSISNGWKELDYKLAGAPDQCVQGAVLIGISEEDFEKLDNHQRVPMHRTRDKVTCTIGGLRRTVHIYIQQGALLQE